MANIVKDIEEKLRKTLEIKNNLFNAIKSKGVDISNPEAFDTYPQAVMNIKLATEDLLVASKTVSSKNTITVLDEVEDTQVIISSATVTV